MSNDNISVHILPVAFDKDGVIAGLKARPANVAVLVNIFTEESREEKIGRRNVRKLAKKIQGPLSVENLEIDSYETEVIYRELISVIDRYSKKHADIYVNISSGTPLLNAMCHIAALTKECHSYVVRPAEFLVPPYKTELSKGAIDTIFLPRPRVNIPDKKQTVILKALSQMGGQAGSQMELLYKLEKMDFFKPEKYFKRRRKKILSNRKTMLSRILNQMENDGMISREKSGRETQVSLTSLGDFLLSI